VLSLVFHGRTLIYWQVKVRFGLFAYAGQERFAAKGYSIARASVIFSQVRG
jgi:hypothetical protein